MLHSNLSGEIIKPYGKVVQEEEVMAERFDSLSQSERWHRLVNGAKRGLRDQGYIVTRLPGRGLSNMVKLERGGKTELAAIRTSQDRYFAFNPIESGGWKTLDEVEQVVLAVVDKPGAAEKIEVYMFPAMEVRERFTASYSSRLEAGHGKKDFAIWLALDADSSGSPAAVGSGIGAKYKPIAVYPIVDLAAQATTAPSNFPAEGDAPVSAPQQVARPTSIAEVLRKAREQVAELAGVPFDAVALDLKIGSS